MVLPAPGYARLFAFLAPCSIRAASQIDGVMRPAVSYVMINDLDRYRAGWIGFSYDWFEGFLVLLQRSHLGRHDGRGLSEGRIEVDSPTPQSA